MRVFWHISSVFNFSKEDVALGYVSTHVSPFSNISSIFKIIRLKSFRKSWGNSCTKFVMPDIKYNFTCGDSDLSETIKKYPSINTKIIWKFSFALYSPGEDSTFWKLCQIWLKNVSSYRKQLMSEIGRLIRSHFHLNQW